MDNMRRPTKTLTVILCLILITGAIAVASASEAAPLHEPAQELGQDSHGAPPGDVMQEPGQKEATEGHEASPEGDEEQEVPTREYGAPAAYFFVGAFILLIFMVMIRYKYDNVSDLSRKIPGLIAATIYIFAIMVIAHYIAGAWSLILVPIFLLALLKFWPHI